MHGIYVYHKQLNSIILHFTCMIEILCALYVYYMIQLIFWDYTIQPGKEDTGITANIFHMELPTHNNCSEIAAKQVYSSKCEQVCVFIQVCVYTSVYVYKCV